MSALAKEIAEAVDSGLFGGIPGHSFKVYQPEQRLNAIAAADAAIQPLVALLERSRDREYNPFEPDNQSKLHADLCAAIAKAADQ